MTGAEAAGRPDSPGNVPERVIGAGNPGSALAGRRVAPAPPPVADEGERRRIEFDLDATLFVEAGAGTGKTTALVARVTNLVASGRVALAEVAAITFTEAAAAELRERIRLSLERAATDPTRPDDERRRCTAALDEVDEAALQTLHGFANRILSAHAVEAGLPPGFTVRNPTEVEVAFDARWVAFLGRLQRHPRLGPPLRAAVSLGLTVDNLRDVARAFHDAWDLAGAAELAVPGTVTGITRPVEAAVAEVRALRPECAVSGDALAAGIDGRLLPWWAQVEAGVAAAGEDAAAVAVALERPVPKLGNVGRVGSWNVPVASVKAAARAVVDAVEEARRGIRQHLLEHLLPELVAFTTGGAEERRRDGILEYHDLLVRARRLLRHDPYVRRAVARRHRVVLVDEFQDTDPLQVDLAVLACTAEEGAIPDARQWSDLSVPPGRLFFVGDPKQSIYRFRRADIDLYARVRDGLRGAVAPLVSNFRSTAAVVDAVNAAFGPWFEEQGEGQAPWRNLVAGRDAAGVTGTVAVLGGIQAGMPAHQAREAAAVDVVACARLAIERGWPVVDSRDGLRRPARADDIAVLLPTRTALPALERAFEDAGLPYRVEARSLVWATQEVRDLLSVLRAVADPGDEVAVVAALLSGVLACSHEDLRSWRAAGGRWDHAAPVPAAVGEAHPVAESMGSLARWAEATPWSTPAALVDRIVRERAVMEAAFALPRQREAWHRVRFVAEQARAAAASGTSALRGFVDWADRQADEQAQALESVVPEADDHAVRVLTIHSAKGLEFPITIVAGLNVPRGGAVTPTTRVLWGPSGPTERETQGPSGTIELSCGAQQRGFRTAGFNDLAAREQVRAEQEQTRLLYVACTRARDHLIVCTHRTGSKRDESSAAAELSAWLAPVPGVLSSLEELGRVRGLVAPTTAPSATASPAEVETNAEASPVGPPDDPAAWEAGRRVALARAVVPAAISATAVVEIDDPAEPLRLPIAIGALPVEEQGDGRLAGDGRPGGAGGAEDDDPGAALPRPGPGGGTAFGRAVHAVLERAPLRGSLDHADVPRPGHDRGVELREASTVAAAAEGVDATEVLAAVEAALRSQAALAAGRARRSWREAFVVAEVDGVVVEGFVDLLWEDHAGMHVADWKTDRVASPADRRAKAGRYALQLATYAMALEHVTGRPVAELVLVFCGAGQATEEVVAGPALSEAMAAVRRRIVALGATS